jgi:rubrerythrin
MIRNASFDPLERFAEIERLVSKLYFRFSHLFLNRPELRDFWWDMAREEEQHALILQALRVIIENYGDEGVDPEVNQEKADHLKATLEKYLRKRTRSITVEEAFRIALDVEGSEIDAIYRKLIQLGGPKVAKTMENLAVPAKAQREKLKAALRRFCNVPELLAAAEKL